MQQLEALLGRFKVHARRNDATRAEHFYRAYIQAGGAPRHWMLPMLLGTYGRLRQADKAWAIYRQLVPDPQQAQRTQQGGASDADAPSAAGSAAAAGAGVQRSAAAPAAAAAAEGDSSLGEGEEHHAWEGRLAARQQELDSAAAQLVQELRLDVPPLNEYGYGALLTALSRAEHPPYDLPARYAEKAAQAFEEMQAAGVVPNAVLWHNLLDCQAKAGQPDAAFATYRRMLAAGAAPNSWTFSMLVSACGRARQPGRASEVVERLMPQAGVAPSLTVWNSLLGAYGRAGSVDAAYAAWLRMLESGTIPDDCTERSLALAFGSHPALAAEVVAEARQIRQQRAAEGGLDGAADGADAQAQGSGNGGGGEEQAGAAGATDGSAGKRPPYRLHQHRQGSLAVDRPDHISQRSQRRNPAPGLLMSRGLPGAGAAGGAGAEAVGSGAGSAADGGSGSGEEAEGQGLQLRQLLVLDLHGSSQAAARMVLLRRLEALVMHAAELFAEMERMEAEHYRRQEWQQQLALARRQTREASRALLRDMQGGSSGGSSMVDDGGSSSGNGGRLAEPSSEGAGTAEGEAAAIGQQQQHEALQQQQQQQQGEWPTFGQRWGDSASSPRRSADPAADADAADGDQQQQGQQGQLDATARPRGRRFLPPGLNIITGVGRHSKGDRGGVLKAAVQQVLQQQGLGTVDDPTNEGVVIVPWPVLAAYLEQQREAMDKDHFFSAARMRYLYVLSGVAGLAAAANLLPRLAPWLPS
ncbi:Glutathione S-transferase theta-2B [Chlorella sorokiniana]|uniref:Glutathione S-transferase theta-2B n=1 Tax=Chlorella sorokiniana TaxID=3076 RepID=A0A2P6TP78_CHLSO|nr:Glutathione S-transferase theta-2B [Chlorella sorokiniana]|eukprot:PRW51133.1 Glutathione S-transferase theta-2B [Chlorella sorokiniana]